MLDELLQTTPPHLANGSVPLEDRADIEVICNLVEPHSKVLDLGCGNGDLLMRLRETKQVSGRGVEISEQNISECIRKGISVTHTNIDEGLADYNDKSFDYVVLNQTLQAVLRPKMVMEEMLRVGKRGIVSFPNFAYWRMRVKLLFTGRMPCMDHLPYAWYETPNLHHLTVRDFRAFCHESHYRILCEHHLHNLTDAPSRYVRSFSNWSAQYGLFLITNMQ